MITPAYSPTATERVLPRMALDFTTGVLDSRVTVARLLNTATRVNASGLIEIVNANLPRFDYNPITLAPKGLLIEESRANLLPQSSGFNTGSWTVANATITAAATTSPDGTVNASKLAENTTAVTDHPVYTTGATTVSIGSTYTETFYLKASERTWAAVGIFDGGWLRAFFDLANGVVGTVAAGITATITPAGNGYYRCSVTRMMATTAAYAGVWTANANNSVSFAGTVGSGIFVWGAQIEAGAFATSYIPTTTTSLTRNADAVFMTGTNLTDWYNATEGSLLVQANPSEAPTTDANVRYAAILYESATFANAIRLERLSGNYRGVKTVAGSSLVASAAWASNLTAKAIFAYKNVSSATSFNAGNPGLYAGGVPSGIAYLGIGGTHQGGNVWCGHVQRILYWSQRVTNAETQAFSK